MSDGFGAAFFGVALYAVLLLVATLLAAATAGALYWREGRRGSLVRTLAVGLVAVAAVVVGFGIALLADEATALGALFAAVVAVPLVAVAARQLSTATPVLSAVARAGMAWSLPFLVGSALLFAVQTLPAVSATVATLLAGAVTTGGALLLGEYLGGTLDDGPRGRADV